MKIAMFGKTGQVANEVQRRVPRGVGVEAISRLCADFTSPDAVSGAAWAVDADVFLNAVAYTAVDRAEDEPERAREVNATAVGAMAEALAERDIPLIHISTDYVFDGTGDRAFRPDDPTAPLGVYGQTKLEGEEAIRASGVRHVILRTSWVFSAHGQNFVKTMLRLGAEREELTVVADQVGGPTPAAAIADACFAIARKLAAGHPGGTFHFAGKPDVSWAGFAREIMEQAALPARVKDVPSSAYPTTARRPMNSRLNCSDTRQEFGVARPDWREGLREVLADLKAEATAP